VPHPSSRPQPTFLHPMHIRAQYPPMRRQVDHASWLASSACQQGNGAFTRDQWDWALSVCAAVPPSAALSCMVLRCLMPMLDACSYARG
jgi:hypothetical protein